MARCDRFALPKGWTKTIRSNVLHAVSLASAALTSAWSRGGKKPTPESPDRRRVGAGEDRDRSPERRVEHQGCPVEPYAAEASTLLQSHPADAHSPPEGGARLVYVADRADISGHRGDHRFLVEADR